MIDAIELIDQYEDAEFPNSLVFAEPYNVQVNNGRPSASGRTNLLFVGWIGALQDPSTFFF